MGHLAGSGGEDEVGVWGAGALDPDRDADLHARRGPVAAPATDLLHARGVVAAVGAGACERAARAAGGGFGRVSSRPAFRGSKSEEHTSELQSLMRISYAVFCLKKKNKPKTQFKYYNHKT